MKTLASRSTKFFRTLSLFLATSALTACSTDMNLANIRSDALGNKGPVNYSVCLDHPVAPPGALHSPRQWEGIEAQREYVREYAEALYSVSLDVLGARQLRYYCPPTSLRLFPAILDIREKCRVSCSVEIAVVFRVEPKESSGAPSDLWSIEGRSNVTLFDQPYGMARVRRAMEMAVSDVLIKLQERLAIIRD